MNHLPAEIAFIIATNVPEADLHALTLVNRQFNNVANPLLWRSITIWDEQQLMKLLRGKFPSSRHDLLQYVRLLTINYPLADATFMLLIPLLPPLLEHLDLEQAKNITNASFNYLPQQCPHLMSLSLRYASITNQSLVSVGQHCHQLRYIYLLQCENLSSHLFAALAACPLKDIYHSGTVIKGDNNNNDNDDDDDDDEVTSIQTMTHDLVTGFPLLTSLNVDEIDGRELVDHTTPAWPKLIRFQIGDTWLTDVQDIITFIRTHPHLRVLQLANNHYYDDVLQVIADTLSLLTSLSLLRGNIFTHHGVRSIVQQCPLLTSFDLCRTNVRRMDFPEFTFLGHDDEQQQQQAQPYLVQTTRKITLCGTELERFRRALTHNNNNNNNDTTRSNR
ncbi:unnamed protein product [Absidia cylindrospora]